MIATIEELERRLKQLDPESVDVVVRMDELVDALEQGIAPLVYEAVFRFFEAYPAADCGAPGAFVHHIENYYPNYVSALRQSVNRCPSYNGVLMINRILNSETSLEERAEYLKVLKSAVNSASAPDEVRSMAERFLVRHT